MADTEPISSFEWRDISISDGARAQLGHSYITNNIHVTDTLARKVYHACMNSSESFRPLAKEIMSCRGVLEMAQESIVGLDSEHKYQDQVELIVAECHDALQALQTSVTKFENLPVASQRTWERMEMGVEEVNQLQERIVRNIGLLSSLNNSITSSSQATVIAKLEKFINEVRLGRREGSVVSAQSVDSLSIDEKEAWRSLRKELEDIGITPLIFTRHRDLIVKILRDAMAAGDLEDSPPSQGDDNQIMASLLNTESSWPESVCNPSRSNAAQRWIGPSPIVIASRASKVLFTFFGSNSDLLSAARAGDLARVAKLLSQGVGLETREKKTGETALILAGNAGQEQVVWLLLESGADITAKNKYGYDAIQVASENGQEQVVRLLLERGADITAKNDDSDTALTLASCNGHEQVVRLLLEKGADITARNDSGNNALLVASCNSHEQVVRLLLEKGADVTVRNDSGNNALLMSSIYGHEQVVRLLLEKGADITARDEYGNNALLVAIIYGHEQVVRLLLQKGADLTAKNNSGNSALLVANKSGQEQVVRLLLENGADITVRNDSGNNALLVAIIYGHEQVVRLLLEKGADLTAKNNSGNSALLVASKSGQEQVVRLLLEKGADIKAKNNNGYSASMLAGGNGRKDIERLLLKRS